MLMRLATTNTDMAYFFKVGVGIRLKTGTFVQMLYKCKNKYFCININSFRVISTEQYKLKLKQCKLNSIVKT